VVVVVVVVVVLVVVLEVIVVVLVVVVEVVVIIFVDVGAVVVMLVVVVLVVVLVDLADFSIADIIVDVCVLGHFLGVLQGNRRTASPTHSPMPSPQDRLRSLVPIPQVAEHSLSSTHALQIAQLSIEHSLPSAVIPSQSTPGDPFKHVRSRDLTPCPHDFEQVPQFVQSAQKEQSGILSHFAVSTESPLQSLSSPFWHLRDLLRVITSSFFLHPVGQALHSDHSP
jgi:hypothetical protein